MYAGHIGVGLGAYSFRKTIPLWLLLVAAQIPDWLDAGYCITDADRGPYGLYTHGFAAIAIEMLVFGVLAYATTSDLKAALIVALVVASHWGLDYFTGFKPTWSGGPVVGLDLYAHPIIDVVVESATILAGWLLYRRALPTSTRNHGWTYAMLFTLCACQVLAGAAFALSLGGHTKC
ncbi:MAG: hypothetical protein M3R65_06165 [Gemmatimonadota bacterium]|nr:hypothetical protein [Gemmatimonadota bacterium]